MRISDWSSDVCSSDLLVTQLSIPCDAVRKGWIQTAHSPAMMRLIEQRARQWERRGAQVELLDRDAVARRTGTRHLVGGWIDYRAGRVQPLSYARRRTDERRVRQAWVSTRRYRWCRWH